MAEGEELWKSSVDEAVQPTNYALQADWDASLFTKQYNNLLNQQTDPSEKARLLAVKLEQASDWLTAIPNASLGLKLDNSSFRMVCGLRLGTDICQEHLCHCSSTVL